MLQVDISYRRTCLIGRHVILVNKSCTVRVLFNFLID